LSLETGLDSRDGAFAATTLAGDEPHSVLLCKESVGTLAGLACDIFVNVATDNVLQLLLLEAALKCETI
jgi:hypothetical protein